MHTLQSILLITNDAPMDIHTHFNVTITHPSIDTIIVTPDPTIGIETIRKLQLFSSRRPLKNDIKHIIILDAQLLTTEAQNALLKILEEPPSFVKIILVAPHTHTFLETILSRCTIIRSTIPPIKLQRNDDNKLLHDLLQVPPAERLKLIPLDTKARSNALAYCELLIQAAQNQLHQTPSVATSNTLEILSDCHTHLLANANPTLALTDAILRLQV